MNDGPRRVLGILSGLITAFMVVTVIESLGHRAYPPPPNFDYRDAEKVRIYLSVLPAGALLYILVAWMAGAFAGTWIGAAIARQSRRLIYVVVCGLLLLASIANLVMIPHPVWFWGAALAGIPLAGWLAVAATRGAEPR